MPQINITGSNNPQRPTAKYGPQFDAHARARAAGDAAWEGAYDQRAREAKRRSSAEYQRYLDEQARAEQAGAEQVAAHNREAEALVRRNAARMRALEDLRYRSEKSYEQAQWKRLGDSFTSFNKTRTLRQKYDQAEAQARGQDQRERMESLSRSFRGAMHIERLKRTEARRQAAEDRAARATDPMTYRAENVGRIGREGQAATDRGQWVQRFRSRRELDRIERRYGADPQVAAAIRSARMRMQVADEGAGRFNLLSGRAFGAVAGTLLAPEVAGAFSAIMLAQEAPTAAAALGRSLLGKSAPYTDLQRGAYRLGRVGGFGGQGLIDRLFPGVLTGTPGWMKAYGVTPRDVVDTAGTYGIAQRGPQETIQVVRDILGGAFSMGIDRRQAARSGALGATLGVAGNGLDLYFRKLQTVTSFAVSAGLDRSQSIANVETLLRQGSSAGGGAGLGSGDQMMSLYMRMASSGMPGARTGELQSTLAGGVADTFSRTGYLGNPLQSTMIANAVARRGMPKSTAQLQKLLGPSVDINELSRTPGGRRVIDNIISAAKSGNVASVATWIGQLVASNPQAAMGLADASGMVDPRWSNDLKDIARARLTGTSPAAIVAYEAGTDQPVPGQPMPGGYFSPTQGTVAAIRGMASAAPDLGPDQLLAQMRAESGLNPAAYNPKSGASGLMQLTPETARDLEKKYGLPAGSSADPRVNAQLGARYMEDLYSRLPKVMTPDKRWRTALAEYNWGPAHLPDILAGKMPKETRNYVATVQSYRKWGKDMVKSGYNMPSELYAGQANVGQAETAGGYANFKAFGSHVGGGTGDTVMALAGAASHVSDGFNALAIGSDKLADAFAKLLHTLPTDHTGGAGRHAHRIAYQQHQPGLHHTVAHSIAP